MLGDKLLYLIEGWFLSFLEFQNNKLDSSFLVNEIVGIVQAFRWDLIV